MVPVLLHPQHVHMSAPATCSFDHAESFLFGMEVNQGLNVLLVSCQVIFISSIDDWLYFLFTAFVHSSSVAALSWSQSIKKQSIGKSTCQTVWENNMIPTCENLHDVTWKNLHDILHTDVQKPYAFLQTIHLIYILHSQHLADALIQSLSKADPYTNKLESENSSSYFII